MNASLAAGYIQDELSQLNTSYVDLLLFHHRCRTAAETAAVWTAFEAAKRSGVARHIGVSNFVSAAFALSCSHFGCSSACAVIAARTSASSACLTAAACEGLLFALH